MQEFAGSIRSRLPRLLKLVGRDPVVLFEGGSPMVRLEVEASHFSAP
jgi:hypothetical protein